MATSDVAAMDTTPVPQEVEDAGVVEATPVLAEAPKLASESPAQTEDADADMAKADESNAEGAGDTTQTAVENAPAHASEPPAQTEDADADVAKEDEAVEASPAGDADGEAKDATSVAMAVDGPVPETQPNLVQVMAFVKPEKPKKAICSFWIYSQSVREQVAMEHKAMHGKASFGGVAKDITARFRALPDEERKIYEDKAAADKARYEAEMKVFNEACNPAAAIRAKYAHLIPKKPASVYSLFCQDEKVRRKAEESLKAESKDVGSVQTAAKLRDLWKVVSEEEKNHYMQEHTKMQLEYLGKQKIWQASPEFAEVEKAEKTQEAMQEAVKAALAAEKAAQKAEETKQERLAKKRAKAGDSAETTPVKKARGQASPGSGAKSTKVAPVLEPNVDAKILVEAKKLGMEASLLNLAARPEVMAKSKSSKAILDALKTSGGLVNSAKRALLGL